MSTVEPGTTAEIANSASATTIIPQSLATEDHGVALAQTAANLTIQSNVPPPSPIVPGLTVPATGYPTTGLNYVNPYAVAGVYNPLAYSAVPGTGVQPLAAAANPYYAYQYPGYAAQYNYYQSAAVLPAAGATSLTVANNTVQQAQNKITEDKKSKKKTNNKQKSEQEDEEEEDPTIDTGNKKTKANNLLPIWGNEKTMNLNPLILANIQNSSYFKNDLYSLKTYHEVIDEIYYSVSHLEPWERGSRKTGGQTGMCGSVRGVSAGGIVSTPFCILYKLYTLKLTRKQLLGLLKHKDSSYIRALGFLYIRFTQPPNDFWKWFEPYLEDDEEFEVKAGVTMTIGEMCRHLITKLDWFSTLFPRVPIPVQKELEKQLNEYDRNIKKGKTAHLEDGEVDEEYDRKSSKYQKYSSSGRNSNKRSHSRSRSRSRDRRRRSRSKERKRYDDRYEGGRYSRDRSKDRSRDRSVDRSKDRSRDKHRHR